jgi:3',5'-cyclic AMP phosphodiesterase CpdA
MAARRILVVTTVPVPAGDLRDLLRDRSGDGEPELKVVAPAADVSPLQWLASDEDHARREAAEVAEQTAAAASGEGRVVSADVGDTDPVQAIEDALREWPADEVVVVMPPDDEAGWLEQDAAGAADERFGVPVTRLPYRGG